MVTVIITSIGHWQMQCLKWAKNGTPFQVRDVKKRHVRFCNEFNAAFKYKCLYAPKDSLVIFTHSLAPVEAGGDKIRAFEETVAADAGAMENVAAKAAIISTKPKNSPAKLGNQMGHGLRESDRIAKVFIDERRHRLEEARP